LLKKDPLGPSTVEIKVLAQDQKIGQVNDCSASQEMNKVENRIITQGSGQTRMQEFSRHITLWFCLSLHGSHNFVCEEKGWCPYYYLPMPSATPRLQAT